MLWGTGLGEGTRRYQDTISILKKCRVVRDLGKGSANSQVPARLTCPCQRPTVLVLVLSLAHTQSCPLPCIHPTGHPGAVGSLVCTGNFSS